MEEKKLIKKKKMEYYEKQRRIRDLLLKSATPVFVSNIPLGEEKDCSKQRNFIKKMFGRFGEIVEVRMVRIKQNYWTAHVFFRYTKDAEASLIINGKKMGSNRLHVYLEIPEIKSRENCDEVTQDSMQEKFKEYGKIEYIRIVDTNRGRDAYVCFKEPKSVDLAMEPFK